MEDVLQRGRCGPCGGWRLKPTHHLEKQRRVESWLRSRLELPRFEAEPRVGGFRPDLVWRGADRRRVVVLEVDEDAHRSYPAGAEAQRMSALAEALGPRPVSFVRYNPDSFHGQEHRLRFEARMALLERVLWVELTTTGSETRVVWLFYDGWDGEPVVEVTPANHRKRARIAAPEATIATPDADKDEEDVVDVTWQLRPVT